MKNLYILIAALHLTVMGFAQKAKEFGKVDHQCYFDQRLEKEKSNAVFKQHLEEVEKNIVQERNKRSTARNGNGEKIIIPVVIHVMHTGGAQPENISTGQIKSQIDALNIYFKDYSLEFCIAQNNFQGLPFPLPDRGIIRKLNANVSNFDISTDEAALTSEAYNISHLSPPHRYLNIYIVKSINDSSIAGSIQGYASFPGFATSSAFDGIVMRADAFGNSADPQCVSCYMNPGVNQGKVLVHEIGHYLGLYHTFEMGCSEIYHSNDCENFGDKVCDTPPVAVKNSGCPTGINSCNEFPNLPDDINNFMDYTNQTCLNSFSDGQLERMLLMLNTYRSELIAYSNLVNAGACIPPGLSSNFTLSNYSPCHNQSVNFTAATVSGASYLWDFGDGNTSATQNPSHSFAASITPYTVTLTVSLNGESISSTKQIFSSNCSAINNVESTWFFSTKNALSFHTGAPAQATITNSSLNFVESAATQSNASGQLLFFTNGARVYDNNQLDMGIALTGNTSSYDGALIVPNPANSNEYYLFTKDCMTNGVPQPGLNGFRYNRVQVSGTTATLTAANSNIVIANNPTGYRTGNDGALLGSEGIAAVQNCNGYWIITGMVKTTGFFLAVYELNSNGNILHHSEFPMTFPNGFIPYQSSVRVSPDGNKLALCGLNCDYYILDFNKYTGMISNAVNLNIQGRGACFSPNSQLLYVTDKIPNTVLYQYDINAANIPLSKRNLGSFITDSGQLQLGPNNKIYFVRWSNQLGVIHYPDNLATTIDPNACGFTLEGPIVQTSTTWSLPNIINAKLSTAYNNTITAHPVNCLMYQFQGNICGQTFAWNFGDPASSSNTSTAPNPTHTFSGPGTYNVQLSNGSTTISRMVTIAIETPAISGNNIACLTGQNQTNHSIIPPLTGTITWSASGGTIVGPPNQSNAMIQWTSLPGIATVTITDASGCSASSSVEVLSQCYEECNTSLTLSNQQQTGNEVFNISADITTDGDYLVDNLQTTELLAGNSVQINPNSYIRPGAVFLARIEECTSTSRIAVHQKNDSTPVSEDKLVAYPNPTTGIVNIIGKSVSEIVIYDMMGKNVYHRYFEKETEPSIDISTFQQGIYLLKANINDGTSETIMINKK